MRVLLDTGVLIGLLVPIDEHHETVLKKLALYEKKGMRLVTSDYVIDELLTRVLYDAGAKVAQFATASIEDMIHRGTIGLVPIEADLFQHTLREYTVLCKKGLSFTDATTWVLYKKGAFDELCTFDSDFRKLGITVEG